MYQLFSESPGIHGFYPDYKLPQTTDTKIKTVENAREHKIKYVPTI